VTPISRIFGLERGQSIDRHYIEGFLLGHALDVQGNVLEVARDTYTTRFGGGRVRQSHILHVQEGNPEATIVADLTDAHCPLASDTFDCIILTQTLHLIYDLRAAIHTVHRILKPGGVVLATVPGISQISRYDMDQWGDYWRFTSASARRLLEESFVPPGSVTVRTYGNVLAATAFLNGLAAQELRKEELDQHDPDYQVLIAVRAQKSTSRP
jgi:SAM-dependent methyltransferase